ALLVGVTCHREVDALARGALHVRSCGGAAIGRDAADGARGAALGPRALSRAHVGPDGLVHRADPVRQVAVRIEAVREHLATRHRAAGVDQAVGRDPGNGLQVFPFRRDGTEDAARAGRIGDRGAARRGSGAGVHARPGVAHCGARAVLAGATAAALRVGRAGRAGSADARLAGCAAAVAGAGGARAAHAVPARLVDGAGTIVGAGRHLRDAETARARLGGAAPRVALARRRARNASVAGDAGLARGAGRVLATRGGRADARPYGREARPAAPRTRRGGRRHGGGGGEGGG